jgi:hypothetical protein
MAAGQGVSLVSPVARSSARVAQDGAGGARLSMLPVSMRRADVAAGVWRSCCGASRARSGAGSVPSPLNTAAVTKLQNPTVCQKAMPPTKPTAVHAAEVSHGRLEWRRLLGSLASMLSVAAARIMPRFWKTHGRSFKTDPSDACGSAATFHNRNTDQNGWSAPVQSLARSAHRAYRGDRHLGRAA